MKVTYSSEFYDEMEQTNRTSALAIVPEVMAYAEQPRSVVDIGCGRGLWLATFSEVGVPDILGIDGDYVAPDKLHIPKDLFIAADLTQPLAIDRTFDLAVCLEMAEHVPHEVSGALVEGLTRLAPVILFSAAIPLQGGSHHINEQWPAYWKERFARHGYVPVDPLRRKFWNDSRVSFFYAQNVLFYVKEAELTSYPLLVQARKDGYDNALPLVHPHLFKYYSERWRMVVPFLGKLPPGILHFGKKCLAALQGSKQ